MEVPRVRGGMQQLLQCCRQCKQKHDALTTEQRGHAWGRHKAAVPTGSKGDDVHGLQHESMSLPVSGAHLRFRSCTGDFDFSCGGSGGGWGCSRGSTFFLGPEICGAVWLAAISCLTTACMRSYSSERLALVRLLPTGRSLTAKVTP